MAVTKKKALAKKKTATKKRAVRKERPARAHPYVAVVMRKGLTLSNRQPYQDWSCFVDFTKETATKRALKAARGWGSRYGEYDILVGALTEMVKVPVQFEFEKL
jgi:hypothetical protein